MRAAEAIHEQDRQAGLPGVWIPDALDRKYPHARVFRRWVFPACDALELPRASSLTFRRTFSSWAHDKSVPGKVVAGLMGHAEFATTLSVYTQVLDDSLRAAGAKVGEELFTIVHEPDGSSALTQGKDWLRR